MIGSPLLLSPFIDGAIVVGAAEELLLALADLFVAVAFVAGLPPALRAI